jgi:hypothetical protein
MDYNTLPQDLRELIETRLRFYCQAIFDQPSECSDCQEKNGLRHWRCDECAGRICEKRPGGRAAYSLTLHKKLSFGPVTFERDEEGDGFLCASCVRHAIEEWSLVDWEISRGIERAKPKKQWQSLNGRPRNKISPTLRFKIFTRDGHRCVKCGRGASNGVTLQVDHRIPVAKGGTEDEENLQTLCSECNGGKADKVDGGGA